MRALWLVLLPSLASAQNRGVPQSGFPSYQERMIFVWTNRARADRVTELSTCAACAEKACYSSPMVPLIWNYNLNRSSRFHAANLESTTCFQHDSPCTLVAGIASVYIPVGSCLGLEACACSNAHVCGTVFTPTFTRIASFGTSGSAENIAYSSGNVTPQYIFNLWIDEPDSDPTCGFRGSNGHRYSILNPSNLALGAGYYRISRDMYVQDFASSGVVTGTLITGGHDPQLTTSGTTTVNFRVNYYDVRGGPQSAQVNIDGTCSAMTQERGVTASNATWLKSLPLTGTTCRRYVFEFKDPAGATVRLPESGSYGVGDSSCADWTAVAPANCGSVNAAPTIATAAAATPNPVAANTTALSVLGADDGGEAALTYTWSATGPAAVTFSANATNAAKASTATFTKAGSYPITVTVKDAQALTVTSLVTVTVSQTLTTITVTPATATIGLSATQQFTASAKDQFGDALGTQPTITWTVSGGGTIDAAGLLTAGATAGGPFTVTAASGGKSGTASVTVSSGSAPTVATAAAATPNPVAANTAALSVLGADDGGELALVYTWASTGPAAVAFSASGTNAARASTATFTKAGSYTLTVTIKDAGNQTVTSSVVVTVSQTLTAISVAPATATVALNASQQFTASAKDQFGDALATQPAITWTTSGGGTISATGLFTAGATAGGPFTVTAASGGKSGTAQVTISSGTAPTIATAAGATPNPVPGLTTALTVLGADDGGEAALSYSWTATGPAPVTFSANASNSAKASTATFTAAGSYALMVTVKDAGNLTAVSSVTVTVLQTPTALTVSPATANVLIGGTQQFSAAVVDQFGATVTPAPAVTWSASGGVTVSIMGVFAATAAGTFTITATAAGLTGTAQVVVGAPVDVTPPLVVILSPAQGATVSGSVVIAADATDDVGVASVEFFVDGVSVGSSATAPWAATWDASTAAPGDHRLRAHASDTSANGTDSAEVTVTIAGAPADTTAPMVRLTRPLNGASVTAALSVTADASDDVGVVRVVFRLDGAQLAELAQAPWSVPLDAAVGKHTLTASAFDAAGNQGDATPIAFERVKPPASDVSGVLSCGCSTGQSSGGVSWMLLGVGLLLAGRRRTFSHRK